MYSVVLEGGLQIGNDAFGPPLLNVRGQLVSDGDSVIMLEMAESWSPVPMLVVPRLSGACIFRQVGNLTTVRVTVETLPNQAASGRRLTDATAAQSTQVIIPGMLELQNVYVRVDVACFYVCAMLQT